MILYLLLFILIFGVLPLSRLVMELDVLLHFFFMIVHIWLDCICWKIKVILVVYFMCFIRWFIHSLNPLSIFFTFIMAVNLSILSYLLYFRTMRSYIKLRVRSFWIKWYCKTQWYAYFRNFPSFSFCCLNSTIIFV